MGLRGVGATPLSKRKRVDDENNKQEFGEQPWDDVKLTRAEKVITFCEQLMVTSGPEAYTKLRLRKWQKQFTWNRLSL